MLRAAARLRIHLPPWGTRTTRCFVPGAAASSDWSPHITVLVPGAASSASSASSAVVPQYSSDMLPRPPSSTCAVPQPHLHCLGRPPAQSPHALAHSLRSPRSPTTTSDLLPDGAQGETANHLFRSVAAALQVDASLGGGSEGARRVRHIARAIAATHPDAAGSAGGGSGGKRKKKDVIPFLESEAQLERELGKVRHTPIPINTQQHTFSSLKGAVM